MDDLSQQRANGHVAPPVKGAVSARASEVLEVQEVQVLATATRAREAAAAAEIAEVEEWLTRLNVVGDRLREQAIAEPARALAQLKRAAGDPDVRNPAGFFRTVFESGEWPTPRIEPGARKTKHATIENLVKLRQDPDEIRRLIDVEWDTLAAVERSELHELLEQLLSGDPAEKALRAVDAA